MALRRAPSAAALAVGARFLWRLPFHLRRPLTPAVAQATLERRRATREDAFLELLRRAVYGHPGSPYLGLLRAAGCEESDVARLVREKGVEGALLALFRAGVYLSVDEFKGRTHAVRGSATVAAGPELLQNPLAAYHLPARSGGSRSSGTRVLIDLAFVRGCAVDTALALEARGGADWLKATWETPGAGARFRLLKLASFGRPPARWFSQVDPESPGLDRVFRLSERAMRIGSRAAHVPLPRPEHAPLGDPEPVLRWLAGVLGAGRTPFLFTFPSSALALCRAALEASLDLTGTQLTLAGEPITRARLDVIEATGARALPRYGSIETGPIGYGCLAPVAADDVHLLDDLHGLVQPGDGLPEKLPPTALFVTALHRAAPFVMLNVSLGDQATLEERSCGCPLEQLGWRTHLRAIRSYEKLSVGGLTFLDGDLIPLLEEVLPARFGGQPTDYQLLEEEAPDGAQVLRILVHPRLGAIDAAAVGEAFEAAIGPATPRGALVGSMVRGAASFVVERREPVPTRSGKILHLHADGPR